ncbi:alpha-1,3-mannosyltransferase [Angomonas deanei]|uniref:dolichyl-P-Man:Man5GlcNAc2-PP-dolichol alpha-1,3-mannosyltransferase n=1 Tax=Angomonas deanei TaxID=59799 RepID=A0A7G2C492_9TRYP|nr:alpha-1,3-mannosyltransferase [Angomonas deanei]CAD2214335.1 ALG3 protein, putative [Angomonas deanei]|eukprot:EPY37543.1 alpha-1,3-mannosyltransferase [Angomonas deanei]
MDYLTGNKKFNPTLLFGLLFAFLLAREISGDQYTGAEWETYMKMVQAFRNPDFGEDVNPVEAPHNGGFSWLYLVLFHVTKGGANVLLVQLIHAAVGVLNIMTVATIFYESGLPALALIPTFMNSRLRQIYALDFLSDTWCVLFLHLAILYLAVYRKPLMGCLFYGLALTIHVGALYMLPGLLVVLVRGFSVKLAVRGVGVVLSLQVLANCVYTEVLPWFFLHMYRLPTILKKPFASSVNYQFVLSETIYDSDNFGTALLCGTGVVWFLMWALRWRTRALVSGQEDKRQVTANMTLTLIESILIGVVLTRSVEYRYLCWLVYAVPYSMSFTKLPKLARILPLLALRYGMDGTTFTPKTCGAVCVAFAAVLLGMLVFRDDKADFTVKPKGGATAPAGEEKKNQ